MTLKEIAKTLGNWLEVHDYDDEFDEFDDLCCKIMSDEQTYFQWEVDNDTFDIIDAFSTVLNEWMCGKQIVDYHAEFLDGDRLFLFVEYKKED